MIQPTIICQLIEFHVVLEVQHIWLLLLIKKCVPLVSAVVFCIIEFTDLFFLHIFIELTKVWLVQRETGRQWIVSFVIS